MLAVIAEACPPLIVVVSPASAVVLLVPNCKVVTEPPSEIAEPSIDIEEFANLLFAIEPANCVFVIVPLKLLVKYPVESAKSNAGVASEPPSDTETPPNDTDEFDNLEFPIEPANLLAAIEPAKSSFVIEPSVIA